MAKSSADYWKYRIAHERAAHAATKKEARRIQREMAGRIKYWERSWLRLTELVHRPPD